MLANRNVSLIVIRIIVSFVKLAGMAVFAGIPLVAGILYLGMDIAQARDLIPFLSSDPFAFVNRYSPLVMLAVLCLFSYVTLSSLLTIYVFGGTLGVLQHAAEMPSAGFSLRKFMQEAAGHFTDLMWLLSLLSLVVVLTVLAILLMTGAGSFLLSILTFQGTLIDTFFGSFSMLAGIVFSAIALISGLVITVYASVVIVAEKRGVLASIRATVIFLRDNPAAVMLYILLIAGIIIVTVLFYGMYGSFAVFPFMIPLAWLAHMVLKNYLAIFVWGSLVACYADTERPGYSDPEYEI